MGHKSLHNNESTAGADASVESGDLDVAIKFYNHEWCKKWEMIDRDCY